ncbi:fruit-body specific protein a [Moniliophthora roreri]|nr:fruit-body specific protein a [Moniliophthora roreri]
MFPSALLFCLAAIAVTSTVAFTSPANFDIPADNANIFEPLETANNAPGYMSFAFLAHYDVEACADLCST